MTTSPLEHLHKSPLLHCFEAFYYDVLRQKEKALRFARSHEHLKASYDPAGVDGSTFTTENASIAEEIQQALRRSIDEQAIAYTKMTGGISPHMFQEVRYIMVALVDEIFLNFSFSGAREWRLSLLEGQLFQSQIAGELIFKRIDAMLESPDASRYELGQIYLMALSLGFKGQYSDVESAERLQWYHDQLYLLLAHQPPRLFYPGQDALMDQCYHYTFPGMPSKGLPDLKTWTKYLAWAAIGYLLMSQLVWYKMTHEIKTDMGIIASSTRNQRVP